MAPSILESTVHLFFQPTVCPSWPHDHLFQFHRNSAANLHDEEIQKAVQNIISLFVDVIDGGGGALKQADCFDG